MTADKKQNKKTLFLLGVFSATQINLGGYLGISEFIMLAWAPFVFMRNRNLFRRDCVMPVLCLAFLWLCNGILSDVVNGVPLRMSIKGLANIFVVIATITCVYPLLRKCPNHLKWFLLGSAISSVISIFVFQKGSAYNANVASGSQSLIESVVEYKLFWLNMACQWGMLPIMGWYPSVPMAYSMFALSGLSVFALLRGGRSAFLAIVASLFLILIGKKRQASIRFISKNIILIILGLGLCAVGVKVVYKKLVTTGVLGEGEQQKYEVQTRQGEDILHLLMGGRVEFFVGIFAAAEKPFIGHGTHALDVDHYYPRFVAEYGNEEDAVGLASWYDRMSREGLAAHIPAHSHIVMFWLWHGIFGLIFWGYVVCLILSVVKSHLHVMPEYFGYFACVIPSMLWAIFFSPFGGRTEKCVLIVCCLLVRAIKKQNGRLYSGISPLIKIPRR